MNKEKTRRYRERAVALGKTRLEVVISIETKNKINELAKKRGVSMAEVVEDFFRKI